MNSLTINALNTFISYKPYEKIVYITKKSLSSRMIKKKVKQMKELLDLR
jgi:hypothetical protein